MSSTDDAINAASDSIGRARGNQGSSYGDTLVRGAAIGAVVSLPIAGIGLLGGALLGAGVAAVDKILKD
jgi:hypothetical protein